MALRMIDTGILIDRQLVSAPVDNQCLFEVGKKNQPANRRLRRSDQQPVIPAGVEAHNRRRSKTTQTVCLEPLTLRSAFKIPNINAAELNHFLSSLKLPRFAELHRRGR